MPTDYEFDERDAAADGPKRVRLSELFGDKDTLFLCSFMVVPAEQALPFVVPCPSCTSIIDGVDGSVPHITQRIAFAVAAEPPIQEFRRHGESRGWRNARLLSAAPSTYSRDYGAEDKNGFQWPIANVFVRREDGIHHFWGSELWWEPNMTKARALATSTSCGRCGWCSTARPTAGPAGSPDSSTDLRAGLRQIVATHHVRRLAQ